MTPEETFQKLLEARGLGDAQAIPVGVAKESVCSHFRLEEQSHKDRDKLYDDHMERCHAEEHLRAPVGFIESRFKDGVAIHMPRYCGKTRALLNYISRLPLTASIVYIGSRAESMRLARTVRRLEGLGSLDNITFLDADDYDESFRKLHRSAYIVVDEWWDLRQDLRDYLGSGFRIIAAVGTIRPGEEFRIPSQRTMEDREREIEMRVHERLREEMARYSNTMLAAPIMIPMPKPGKI